MVDIVFIDPFTDNCDRDTELLESLHLAELEAYLQMHGLTTYRVDARQNNLSVSDATVEAIAHNPCCISIWIQYRSLEYCLQFIRELGHLRTNNRPLVVAEGNVATFSTKQLLQNTSLDQLDIVMVGEVEGTLLQVVQAIKNDQDWKHVPGLVFRNSLNQLECSPRHQLTDNLDKLPPPFRRTTHFSTEKWVEIRSSRGCYYDCSFCNIKPFFSAADGFSWRGHSVSRVLQEIHDLYGKGVRRFYFVDEIFFGPGLNGKKRVHQIAQRILEDKLDIEWQIFCRIDDIEKGLFQLMQEAGLSTVNVGMEGGSQSQLDRMNKHQTLEQVENAISILQRLGITIIPSFIMFDPYVRLEEIEATINLIRRLGVITYLGSNCIIPYEGTLLTKQIITDDLLDEEHPIVDNYIPGVRMKYPEVEILRSAWSMWRPWIDETYNSLATHLTRIAHAFYMNSTPQNSLKDDLFPIAQQLKEYEANYVLSCIQQLQNGTSLGELLSLRSDWNDAITQINLAFSRLVRV